MSAKLGPIDILPLRACVEGFVRIVEERNHFTTYQEKLVSELTADIRMCAEAGLKYGDHNMSCNYIEEAEAGRVINNEKESCDCGWYEMRQMLKDRIKD